MPQLLLELFSEEIPARMQGNAARDLERMARDGLAKAGLMPQATAAALTVPDATRIAASARAVIRAVHDLMTARGSDA